ncbi:MAG: substrate-binding domain-containing protein [Candidatus Sumerlaeaceae bacterium]
MRLFITAGLVLAIGAAWAQDAAKKPASEKKSFTFGVIAKSNSNPVFQAALKGAQSRAKELSKDGLEIKIDWRTPNDEDAQKQADNIEQLVNAGVDGISIACSDASKVTNAINDAVGKGVPVMCFDSDAPKSKRFAYFGVDDIQTGERVMAELDKALGGKKGRIAVLAGNQTAPNLQLRVQGVMSKGKELGYTIDKSTDVFYHKETPQDAASKVEDVMKSNPDIVGWAMIGGWPLFTDALLKMKPGVTKIVAVDALPAELPYVETGVAQILLAQKVFDWGTQSVDLLLAKAQGKEVKERNISELVPVTKDNLKEWAQTLKTWGFEVNPKYLQ